MYSKPMDVPTTTSMRPSPSMSATVGVVYSRALNLDLSVVRSRCTNHDQSCSCKKADRCDVIKV